MTQALNALLSRLLAFEGDRPAGGNGGSGRTHLHSSCGGRSPRHLFTQAPAAVLLSGTMGGGARIRHRRHLRSPPAPQASLPHVTCTVTCAVSPTVRNEAAQALLRGCWRWGLQELRGHCGRTGGLEVWDSRTDGECYLRSPLSWGFAGNPCLDPLGVRSSSSSSSSPCFVPPSGSSTAATPSWGYSVRNPDANFKLVNTSRGPEKKHDCYHRQPK